MLKLFERRFEVKSKRKLLLPDVSDPKMLVRLTRHTAASRRARQEAFLKKIWLIDVLQGNRFLVDRGSQGVQPDGAAAVKLNDAAEHPAVERIQSELIDLQA